MTISFEAFSASETLADLGQDADLHSEGDLRAYYDREQLAHDRETLERYGKYAARLERYKRITEKFKRFEQSKASALPSPEFKVGDLVACGKHKKLGEVVSLRGESVLCEHDGPPNASKPRAFWRRHELCHADPSPPVSERDWDAELYRLVPGATWSYGETASFHGWCIRDKDEEIIVLQLRGEPAKIVWASPSPCPPALARLLEDRNAADERNGPDRYLRVEDWDARLSAIRPGWTWKPTVCPDAFAKWTAVDDRGCDVVFLALDGTPCNHSEKDPALVALVRERNADQLREEEAKREKRPDVHDADCGDDNHFHGAGHNAPCSCGAHVRKGVPQPAFADHDGAMAMMAGAK